MKAYLSKLVIWGSALLLVYILFNRFNWKENTALQWDQSGYYLYLPAALIYDDLDRYAFYPELNKTYRLAPGRDYYALHEQAATGRRLNKYPVGVALFHAPFFLVAHAATRLTGAYPADGFSAGYRLAVCLGTIFWSLLGLELLRRLLRRYVSERIVAAVLVLILFGTNLYNYTGWDFGMSHPYSFFLFAAALFLADRWHRSDKGRDLILLGGICGLIVIVRPLNVILLPLLLLWQPGAVRPINPLRGLVRRKWELALAAASFFAIISLQLAYWKYASGNWIHYSYEGEGFDFSNPQLLNGLFSYRKGWLLYTPLAGACILGIIPLIRNRRAMGAGIAAYLAVTVYLVFSWKQWYYGGSFGCRVMVESLAVLAFPLACFLRYVTAARRPIRIAGAIALILCLALNLWQTYQFNIAVIPTDGNTREWYWRAFFKLEKTAEDEALFKRIVR